MPWALTNDKSTSVQVMAWCRQATSHYLSKCWPSSMWPYGVARPQCVNSLQPRDIIWRCGSWWTLVMVMVWCLTRSLTSTMSLTLDFQCENLKQLYLRNGKTWHERKGYASIGCWIHRNYDLTDDLDLRCLDFISVHDKKFMIFLCCAGGNIFVPNQQSWIGTFTNCWLDWAQIWWANSLWASPFLINFWSCSTDSQPWYHLPSTLWFPILVG